MAGVRRQPGVGTEAGGLPPSLCLEALPPGTVGLDKDTPLMAARSELLSSALEEQRGHPALPLATAWRRAWPAWASVSCECGGRSGHWVCSEALMHVQVITQ